MEFNLRILVNLRSMHGVTDQTFIPGIFELETVAFMGYSYLVTISKRILPHQSTTASQTFITN